MKIGHQKDFWGGMLFIALGLLFAVIARGIPGVSFLQGYTMGTPARMGPGFFPFYLGALLVLLGVIVAVGGIRGKAGEDSGVEKFHWKPILWVLGAVVLFGLVLKPLGMLIGGWLLVVIACYGSYEFQWKRSVILGAVLSVFCAFTFVAGLKLPIPLCPDIESLQSAVGFCRS
jgi:hypothetical protein